MTSTATPLSTAGRAALEAEASTIRSRSSAKSSAAAVSSRTSSAAAGPTRPNPSAAMISATTWKSPLRKPPMGARKKSRSPSRNPARLARAPARKPVPASGPARAAVAAVRSSTRAVSSASPRPVRTARAQAACSKSPAEPVAARDAASGLRRSNCASPPAWTPARGCARLAMVKLASAAAHRAIYTSCCTSRPMPSSSATATICFAKCQ